MDKISNRNCFFLVTALFYIEITLYNGIMVNSRLIKKTLDIFNFSFLHLIISYKKQKQFDISRPDHSRLKALCYSTLVFSTRCSEFAFFSKSYKLCLTMRTIFLASLCKNW